MTPEEAREIDRLEFKAECRAVREHVFAHIADRHGAERARVLRWMDREPPKAVFAVKTVVAAPRPRPVPQLRPRREGCRGDRRPVGDLSMTLREWADHLGITYNNLNQRIHKLGSLEAVVKAGGAKKPRGVSANSPEHLGTGGGPTTQDFTEIEFSH